MNFDRRSIAAIVLCMVFFYAYQHYLNKKYPNMGRPASMPTAPSGSSDGLTNTPAAQQTATAGSQVQQAEIQQLSDNDLTIETDTNIYKFSQATGGLASISLKNYTVEAAKKGETPQAANLVEADGLILQTTSSATQLIPVSRVFHAERQGRVLRFWRDEGSLRLTQEYRIPELGYGVEVVFSVTNLGAQAVEVTTGYLARELITFRKSKPLLGILPGTVIEHDQMIYSVSGSVDHADIQKACGKEAEIAQASNTTVDYLGYDKHYFLTAFEPQSKTTSFKISHSHASEQACTVTITGSEPQGMVQANQTASLTLKAFFGPKDLEILRAYDPRLESSVNFGVFGFIARPLLFIIKGFYSLVKNWGLAIIILTLLLKVLFYPLTKSSAVSMHRMKKLNPQMNALKEKFADDKPRQQQELMKFMAANKINPMKGCLPILPQIPVFFAFYQVLQNAIELRHAPFFGWINDLASPDAYLVTPLLMGVAMYAQQKLTPTTGMDKTQEKILQFMPIIFTVMMLNLPAGLTLYMLTNTVTGIIQQKWLYRKLEQQGS